MDPGLLSWLPLVVKVGLTALVVVAASVLSERMGALVGAMIVTLPVTVWPAYLFLSLDHTLDFMVQAAIAGLAVNAVTAIFYLVYIGLAQRCWLVVSLGGAIPVWIALAVVAQSIPWTFGTAILLNLVCYPAAAALSYRYRAAVMPRLSRKWYDLPLRVLLVCSLIGTVLVVSAWAGPTVTGLIAVYPISSTATMLILHARVGGPASASVVANGLLGMAGISLGLATLIVAMPLGVAPALALALAIPVSWNTAIWLTNRRSKPA